jgi:hypothetical protein
MAHVPGLRASPAVSGSPASAPCRPGSGRRAPGIVLALLVGAALAASPAAHAQGKRTQQYGFVLASVQAADGVPEDAADAVRTRLIAAMDAHERLVATLPADAPDPAADPDAFAAYMKRRKLTPYRVTVEITEHFTEAEDGPRGQRLTASVALRMFGETMPERVMAFSAAGSATIKLDVGKTVRPRDIEVASRDAIAQAVDYALAQAVQRLDEKQKPARKAKKKR